VSVEANTRRVGLWLIGARGSIATCVAYGLSGLKEGLLAPTGILTAHPPFEELDWVPFENFLLGGHDVCTRRISDSAGELEDAGILESDLVAASAAHAAAFEARLRPGVLDEAEVGVADLDPRAAELGSLAPREQVRRVQDDIEQFEAQAGVAATVVVYVASTEADRHPQPEWGHLDAFERALDAGVAQPASVIYAYATLAAGRPFVNFTPSLGARIPALRELARRRGVPHCGNDGKTGETLIKTALAPAFAKRALRVLTWQGYNMLGNRDGEVLKDSAHRQAKLRSKDEALRSILGADESLHSKVGIDYVPSLADWKTAWDFVHFEGFLGVRMSLQFTWMGSDSALAAPLVIDLARLAEFAARAGEAGEMTHTASYFKDPLGGGTHDFHRQYVALLDYFERHLRASRARA